MARALVVVDVQNDFCPGGSLAVAGGNAVAAGITAHLADHVYDLVVATTDWHPAHVIDDAFPHFASVPDYVSTWPVHCVQGTEGAEFHPHLRLPAGTVVVRKGQRTAAYSGFEGHDHHGHTLAEVLRGHGIDEVDVVGLATDHCVRATALDAVAAGLSVRVLLPLVAGVAAGTTARALDELRRAGTALVDSTG